MSCDEDKGENKIFLFLNNFSRGHENDAAISSFFSMLVLFEENLSRWGLNDLWLL